MPRKKTKKCDHHYITLKFEKKERREKVTAGCKACGLWGDWFDIHGVEIYDRCKIKGRAVHNFFYHLQFSGEDYLKGEKNGNV